MTTLSSDLRNLHWLPVCKRIEYKIGTTCFKALHGYAPTYVNDLLKPYIPSRALRSSQKDLLEKPRYKLKTFGERSFSYQAPLIWNSIPNDMKTVSSVTQFKKSLKTFYFKSS